MVMITKNNLRQSVFETVYDLLKAKATSEDYGTSSQPTITASYIDDEQVFPQIVIHSPTIDQDEYTLSQSLPDQEIRILIDVFTQSNKNKDILADNINQFLDETIITGISLLGFNENDAINLDFEDKIRIKSLTYTYKRK